MRANEFITEATYDYRWDEDKCGFFTTIDGVDQEFFPAKSKWDRSEANNKAKKASALARSNEVMAKRKEEDDAYQFDRPLTSLEIQWVELHKKLIAAANKRGEMTDQELSRYKQLQQVVRQSILYGTHPIMKDIV